MKYTETGIHSKSFINALNWAKRKAFKETYNFNELIEETGYKYYLNADEIQALREKLIPYCKKNLLYTGRI